MISRSLLERRRYSCGRGIGRGIYKARPPDLQNAAFVRILVFHGYLLRGTGSNVYNASLVAALARLRHEVHLLCQDRDPPPLPDGVTVHVPDIGGLLPLYVMDEYEGFRVKAFADLTDAELD